MTTDLLRCLDLDPDRIRAPFEVGRVGHQVLVFSSTSSTIDLARRVSGDPTAGGTVIVADRQTSGRGRHGRSWHSPSGLGLWVSVIVDLASDFEDVCSRSGWLSISMTLSVLEALRQLGGSGMGIRWPNDVVDQRLGRKLCGCLAEVNDAPLSTPGLGRAIVSFGLNVGHRQSEDFSEDVRSSAVSLAILASEQDWDCPLDRSDILVQILHRFNGFVINPPTDWAPYWERYSVLGGQMIQVRSGGREWQGQAIGLEKDGSLVMRLSAGRLKNFQSGDVDFLRPIQVEEE